MMPWLIITKIVLRILGLVLFLALLEFPTYVISSSDSPHYMMYNCPKRDYSYTLGSTFQSNLNYTLFTELPAKASRQNYYNFTRGTGIDQVYALFYCRGDVGPQVCQDCVQTAAEKIEEGCKFLKEGIVWFEECTLRYANRTIFFLDEETPSFIYENKTGIMNAYDLDPFRTTFNSTMDGLVKQAAQNGSLQGFATTEVNLSPSKTLRCLVQCTPDIIGVPCDRCLRAALRQIDSWANSMIFLPSCFIRFDLYRALLAPSGPPDGGLSVGIIVLIVLGTTTVIVAILIGLYFCFLKLLGSRDLFTYAELATATDSFSIDNLLGKGGFGSVYKGVLEEKKAAAIMKLNGSLLADRRVLGEQRLVAIKKLKEGSLLGDKGFHTEIETISRAHHKNVVSLFGHCIQGSHKLLVYEYLPNNCLYNNLHDRNLAEGITMSQPLNWETRMKIAVGTAEGLQHLHETCDPKIIHRDVKSANILLSSNFDPKVADFGLAKFFPEDVSYLYVTQVIGSQGYLAPESFRDHRLTIKTDVFAFGVVLLELITGKKAFDLPADVLYMQVRPLLLEALEDGNFGRLIDRKLNQEYDVIGMTRMVICATLSTHPAAKCRLTMTQVLNVLVHGTLSAEDVAELVKHVSSDFNQNPDNWDLDKLRELAALQLKKQRTLSGRWTSFPMENQ